MWPDICRCVQLVPEPELNTDGCSIALHDNDVHEVAYLRINSSVLMSVIWLFVLLLLHNVMHRICLFECQLVLANDLELTRFRLVQVA